MLAFKPLASATAATDADGCRASSITRCAATCVTRTRQGTSCADASWTRTFHTYLRERVEHARPRWIPAPVLLREIRERGYEGSDLVQRLQGARQELRLPQELALLDRFDLLILDDLSEAGTGGRRQRLRHPV